MSKDSLSRGSEFYVGDGRYAPLFGENDRTGAPLMAISKIDLGTPIIGDPNGIVVSQNLTALGVFSSSVTAAVAIAAGALAGVADAPRNVVAAWTGTAILTVTGTDKYDEVMSESSASGTSFAGKKAFKTFTDVSVSADVTSLTVGTGNVLGLPYRLTGEFDVIGLYADAVEEKLAATFVAAVGSVATATSGDIRGTVVADTTLDGSVSLILWMHVEDPGSKEGLVGVPQA